ncbi:MAG TPA: hypothetical protein VFZ59_27785 [Verrucomicrobiae bacterium]|nr:hypothetical protein [Verrucomicrobiae bacterium]
MTTIPHLTLRIVCLIFWAFLFAGLFDSCADSWLPPREFDSVSENRRFIARVVPGKGDRKPSLTVSSIAQAGTNELWKTDLNNDVAPVKVCLSNDGERVVTLDNYFGIGYGDDVVAIYSRKGLLAKYSLEQFAPPPSRKKEDDGLFFSSRSAYEGKFAHSTASRHWREYSIHFFHREGDQTLFCLWLDWDDRWVVWQLSDGKLRNVTANLTQQLNLSGRTHALEKARSGAFAVASLSFLGRQRVKEDRPLIEKWLHDTEFSTGSMQSSSSDTPATIFAFTSQSYRRAEADRILAGWDGHDSPDRKHGYSDTYQSLGILKGVINLAKSPAKGEGSLRLYLISEQIPLSKWNSVRPEHYLIANLDSSYPHIYEHAKIKDGKLSNRVNFIIYGITPGKYRLKAMWAKANPQPTKEEVIVQPKSGDYESTTSKVITIKKGLITEGATVDCTSLVK